MAGPVRIAILANGAQARNEMARTSGAMSRLGGVAKLGALAGAAGLVALGKSAVTAEAQFSTSMRLIQAATGAPASQMKQLNDLAIQLGADTAFSASDAADAMLELAKAGIDTKTIMGGGLSGTLTLAAAGGTDLGTAATIASNALNTFNLRGKDMAKVAAALAGGANKSSASVESLGQGLQQVGPGATNAGLSLQETVATLSAFDAAGIKGSDAGTSLKTMLTRLVPQTDKAQAAMEGLNLDFTKADGSMKSITTVAQQLQKHMGKLSDEERTTAMNTIFGSDATRAATVLMKEGAGGIQKFIKATNDQGAAQKMASARMGGTAGALERLSGSAETAKLRLGQELAPAVETTADFLAKKLPGAMEASIDGAKDFGRAVEPLASVLMDVGGLAADAVGSLDGLPGPLKSVGVQAGIAALALPKLTGAIEAVNGRVSGMVSGMRTAETRTAALGSAAKTAAGIGGILALTSALGSAADDGASFGDVMKGAAGGAGIGAMFGPVGALVGAGVGGGLTALTGAFAETEEEARAARLELRRTEGFKDAKEDADSLRESLFGVVNAYGQTARAAIEASFTGEDGKLDADISKLRSLGVSMDTIISATQGQAGAQLIVNRALSAGGVEAESNRDKYKRMWLEAQDGMTEWTDYYGNVHRKALSSDKISELGRKYRYWDEQVKNGNVDAKTFGRRIEENTGVIESHGAQMRQLARRLNVPLQQYRKFPKAVRTKFEADGLAQTAQDAIRLVRQYKGLQDFKHIRAVISAPGVNLSKKQVEELGKQYKLTPKQVKTLFKLEGVDKAKNEAKAGGEQVKRNLEAGPGSAKMDPTSYHSSIRNASSTGSSIARSGGSGVGASLASGVAAGIGANAWQAVNAAGAMVTQAINEANRKADAHSPSRKMRRLGEWMGDGLVEGMTRRERDATEAGRRLASAALIGSSGNRWGASAIEGRAAAQRASAGGRRTDSPLAHGSTLTLVVEGQPLTAIVRREQAADHRWHGRLDDRD